MEYWAFYNPDETIQSVESHSNPHKVPGAIKITKKEYNEFISSMPKPIPPPEPVAFERLNPVEGVEHRLTHIEGWLEKR